MPKRKRVDALTDLLQTNPIHKRTTAVYLSQACGLPPSQVQALLPGKPQATPKNVQKWKGWARANQGVPVAPKRRRQSTLTAASVDSIASTLTTRRLHQRHTSLRKSLPAAIAAGTVQRASRATYSTLGDPSECRRGWASSSQHAQ